MMWKMEATWDKSKVRHSGIGVIRAAYLEGGRWLNSECGNWSTCPPNVFSEFEFRAHTWPYMKGG
jgi:hypothetical protein